MNETKLRQSEEIVQTFVEKQQALNEIGLHLSTIENSNELYREAIQLGHNILGYDRLRLYLLDSERKMVNGTYGIGRDGQIRHEAHEVFVLADEPRWQAFLHSNERLIVNEDTDLHEDGEVVGHGWRLTTTLWSRKQPIGLLFADNLISQAPLQPHQPELLATFSATIANLIERQRATTEREYLLQNMEQAQARSETILDSITVPMLISRVSDGMIFYTNENLAKLVRLPLNELVGNQTPNFYVHNEDRETIINKIQTEGSFQNYELELQRSDLSRFWGLLTAKLIQFEGEAAILTSLIDISDRIETQAATERQAKDLQTVADLSTRITSIQNPQELMEVIVQETQKRFGLYHCHIFLVDESSKHLRIQACGWHQDATEYGTHGDAVIAVNAKQSLVAQAARTKQAVVINDVANDPNWLPNKLLPDTRAELAVPMIVGDTVVGVLDVQSTSINRFGSQDVQIQSTLAAQIAVALENARSLVKNQEAVAELDALTRRLTRESWEEYLADIEDRDTGFVYDLGELRAVEEAANELDEETAVSATNGHLSQSLMVRGESIGNLTIFNETETEQLGDDAALIMAAVAEQLSARVENIRLTEQTQQALAQTQDQAKRLGLLNEISAEISNVDTLDEVFDVIISRMADLLQADQISVTMLQPDNESVEMLRLQGTDTNIPMGTIMPMGPIIRQAAQENRVVVSQEDIIDGVIKSSMVAPISSSNRIIGTLNIGSRQKKGFSSRDENLMQQLATMLSSVIENKQLLAAAQARAERERQVRTITDKIRRGADREAILTIAQQEISTLIGAKQSAVQLGTKAQLLERIQQTLARSQQDTD